MSKSNKTEQKDRQVRIYPEIYRQVKDLPDTKESGLTYSINKILAQGMNLPAPLLPEKRKAAGGSKRWEKRKN